MQSIDKKEAELPDVIVVKEMRDYSKDPTFVKRAEEAKAYLKKHGLYEKLIQLSEEKKKVDEPQ